MSALKTTLESLVSNNRTKEAISQLIELIDDLHNEPFKQLTMLSSRYTSTNNGVQNQTEEHASAKTEFSRIDYSFLNILSDVREEIQAKMNFYKSIPKEVGDEEILRGFLNTVLMKKYKNVKYFTHGNTFIYFQAQEQNSELEVMVMVLKSSEIKNVMDNRYLNKIAQLKHRNLIQLLDVNFQTYPYYIITEHVSGIDLKTLMHNIGALPIHNAKKLLLIIGDVMNSLKVKKFPYSGIRPSKILIDHELEPEISPFDILAVDANKRLLKSFEEDCYYFSNEILFNSNQAFSPDSTDRASQFCLAALGYEMMTGEKLFFGKNISDILLMRHRFFTDVEFRKNKLEHPRLPKRMVAIFKKMLSEEPQKRYEDIPTALKEIAKVRVVMSDIEDKVFKSYRRCLNNTDDFMDAFYNNLFAHPDMQAKKPKDNETERKRALQEKFYIDINMVFGVENFGNFVEKMATMQQGEINPVSEYTIFLDAFIQTIEACDPRWDNNKDIKKAWNDVKNSVLEQLKNTFPEAETVSNYIPNSVLNTAQIGKTEEKKANTGDNQATESPVSEADSESEPMAITTKMETSFNAEKA
jgi:hypothetical protein